MSEDKPFLAALKKKVPAYVDFINRMNDLRTVYDTDGKLKGGLMEENTGWGKDAKVVTGTEMEMWRYEVKDSDTDTWVLKSEFLTKEQASEAYKGHEYKQAESIPPVKSHLETL